jgi:hypothetical protein
MSSADSNTKVTFRWETRAGEVTETFDLQTLTGAPDDRFLFLDSDDEPRLILSAEELGDLQQRADEKVIKR